MKRPTDIEGARLRREHCEAMDAQEAAWNRRIDLGLELADSLTTGAEPLDDAAAFISQYEAATDEWCRLWDLEKAAMERWLAHQEDVGE